MGLVPRCRMQSSAPFLTRRLLLLLLVALLLDLVPAFTGQQHPGNRRGRRPEGKRPPGKQPEDTPQTSTQSSDASHRAIPRFIPPSRARSPREAAYLAVLAAERDQAFIADYLADWSRRKRPSSSEIGLATLVANVACREAASLDFAIEALAGAEDVRGGRRSVKLKGRQRAVLRTALAQYKYCTRMPLYAIVNDAVELAKEYGGGIAFASFTNALLRKLHPDPTSLDKKASEADNTRVHQGENFVHGGADGDIRPLPLPEGNSEKVLATRLSYPPFLVKALVQEFGKSHAISIMKASNIFPPVMARSRIPEAKAPKLSGEAIEDKEEKGMGTEVHSAVDLSPEMAASSLSDSLKRGKASWETVESLPMALHAPLPLPYTLGVVHSDVLLQLLTQNDGWYITNGTPAGLLARLAQGAAKRVLADSAAEESRDPVLQVLDVCAAPGGKGLAVWDILQGQGRRVSLVMNDVNEAKKARIAENLARFGLSQEVQLTVGDGASLSKKDVANQTDSFVGSVIEQNGFDIVVLDVPCSNAGVLGRRPEARWRLKDGVFLKKMETTQFSLLKHAEEELLSKTNRHAEIWYLTCSILWGEDEGMVEKACKELGLEVVVDAENEGRPLRMKVLPGEGLKGAFDGGFGCALRRKASSHM